MLGNGYPNSSIYDSKNSQTCGAGCPGECGSESDARNDLRTSVCVFQLEFGVVYSCIEDKMYPGRKGKGAFCDGEKLEVSDVKGTSRENVSVCPSVWLSVKETDDRFLM